MDQTYCVGNQKASKEDKICLDILNVRLLIMVLYFYRKRNSSEDIFYEWWEDFKGDVFFLHGTISSCGVMMGYLGNKVFN